MVLEKVLFITSEILDIEPLMVIWEMSKKTEAPKKKVEVPKTIKVGTERFKLISKGLTKTEADKKAEWHRYKGKKVRTKKYGDKYYNYSKLKA